MHKVIFFDSTLRDGSHALKHQFTKDNIEDYCQAMDGAGMNTIIVGHGNGLGASSLQVGLSLLNDREMLKTARKNLDRTKLGAYMIPGFGTIRDNLEPAIEDGVEVFTIGCHCTEADTTRQHIEYIKNEGNEVYGVLMMYHMASTEKKLEALVALMEKCNWKTETNLYKMLDTSEYIMPGIMRCNMGQEPLSIVSGMSGVFSSFKVHVEKAAKEFQVDPRDIFIELGKRGAVGGQEDMIIEIAEKLSRPFMDSEINYQIESLL